jgi:hypothetical protein
MELVCKVKNPDPTIWEDPIQWQLNLFRWPLNPFNPDYHPGAVYDMRSKKQAEYGGAGQQCTYDSNLRLITHGAGAGTPDKAAPGFFGSHYAEDVEPYEWALELDGGKPGKYVEMYLSVRPPNNANNCPINP